MNTDMKEIDALAKDVVVAVMKLMNRLSTLDCISPSELIKAYAHLSPLLEPVSDLQKCCRMPYEAYLHTQRWRNIKQQRLARDNFRCRSCGDSEFIEVHHLRYDRRGMESLDDLQTLCSKCHAQVHGKRN